MTTSWTEINFGKDGWLKLPFLTPITYLKDGWNKWLEEYFPVYVYM